MSLSGASGNIVPVLKNKRKHTLQDVESSSINSEAYDADDSHDEAISKIKQLEKEITKLQKTKDGVDERRRKNKIYAQISRYQKKLDALNAEMEMQALREQVANLEQLNQKLIESSQPHSYPEIVLHMYQLSQEMAKLKREVRGLSEQQAGQKESAAKLLALEAENAHLREVNYLLTDESEKMKQLIECQQIELASFKDEFMPLFPQDTHALFPNYPVSAFYAQDTQTLPQTSSPLLHQYQNSKRPEQTVVSPALLDIGISGNNIPRF